MINNNKIDLIKSLDSNIEFSEDTQSFSLKSASNWFTIASQLKEDFNFDYLMCITSLDLEDAGLALAYNLNSLSTKESIEFKLFFDESEEIPSVESLWKTADWHEREAYDMMGIKFSNHPNLKRILLPHDWDGHPLRKNYKVQDYYHGMYVPKDKTSWE